MEINKNSSDKSKTERSFQNRNISRACGVVASLKTTPSKTHSCEIKPWAEKSTTKL
jgi:hypothetical protein